MNQIDFSSCSIEFEFDGSWNDLYIIDASREDWEKLVTAVKRYPYQWFDRDGKGEIPQRLDQVFFGENRGTLVIDVSGLEINCHFFTESEIEFDLDPRDITGQKAFDAACGFMKVIGDSVGKPVIMTPENFQDHIFFRYDPLTETIDHCSN